MIKGLKKVKMIKGMKIIQVKVHFLHKTNSLFEKYISCLDRFLVTLP